MVAGKSLAGPPRAAAVTALLIVLALPALAPSLRAQGCAACVPLDDLGAPPHRGRAPGLYDGGTNAPPAAHLTLALSQAAQVVPRDAAGAPSPSGLVGWISIGMSNTNQEFAAFERLEDARPGRNPRVVIVDAAVGGQSADVIVNPAAPYWTTVSQRLGAAGLSPAQVQVAWLKEADGAVPDTSFPAHADTLRAHLRSIVRDLRDRFPNLRLCWLSSRTYGGWSTAADRGEPLSFETAFAVRDLIREQSDGSPQLNADPGAGPVEAPVLLWGPYLWARGSTPRASDGFSWPITDVEADRVHPSPSGEARVAALFATFLATEPTAAGWRDAATGEASVVVDAAADAWVDDAQPAANHGAESTLVWSNPAARSYVRFDLPAAPGALLHAKLSLKVPPDPGTSRVEVVGVSNTTWSESTITAANAPAVDGATSAQIPQASRGTALSADVTASVRAALAGGPGARVGFALRALAGPAAQQPVSSRESGDGPRLVLSFAPEAVGAPGPARIAAVLMRAATQPFPDRGELVCTLTQPAERFDLEVFDTHGRRVARLADGARDAGQHRVHWDGRDTRGAPLPAGVYVAMLRTSAGARATARVVLLQP